MSNGDAVLVDGDPVTFTFSDPIRKISVPPQEMVGSGFAMIDGKSVCVVADAARLFDANYTMLADPGSSTGKGSVTMTLDGTHCSPHLYDEHRQVLRVGQPFKATFSVTLPSNWKAAPNLPPQPDSPGATATGEGRFRHAAPFVRATSSS